jgi:hypothetical protein
MGIWGSLFLAMYIGWDGQFLAVFPLVFFTGLAYVQGNSLTTKIKRTVDMLMKKSIFILPAISLLPHIIVWGWFVFTRKSYVDGYIGHLFLEKTYNYAWDPFLFFEGMLLDTSLIFIIASSIAFSYGLYLFYKRSPQSLLVIWAALYLAPWLFAIQRPDTSWRIYYLMGIIPLTILVAIAILEAGSLLGKTFMRKFKFVILSMLVGSIVFSMLVRSLSAAYDITLFGLKTDFYYGKMVRQNYGVKTAGFYARENIPLTSRLFTDSGIPVVKYYFHRMPVADKDVFYNIISSEDENKYEFLRKVVDTIDYIFVRTKNETLAQPYVEKDFYKIIDIYYRNNPVMSIYSRDKKPLMRMDVEKYDRLFDKKYGKGDALRVPTWYNIEVF